MRGVALSSRVVVILGLGEIVILVALAISGLVDPGKGGLNVSPFNPGNAPSANALYLGVIFTILSFSGSSRSHRSRRRPRTRAATSRGRSSTRS